MSSEKIEALRKAIENFEEGGLFERNPELEKVRSRALGLLNHRARSRDELRGRLLDAEFDPVLVEQTIDGLEASGLVNDTAFAQEWVRQRKHNKSSRVLDKELRDKGVAEAVRWEALEQVDASDEEDTARALAKKKAAKISAVPVDRKERDKQLRRIVGVLARRGFNGEMSMRLAIEALEDRLSALDS